MLLAPPILPILRKAIPIVLSLAAVISFSVMVGFPDCAPIPAMGMKGRHFDRSLTHEAQGSRCRRRMERDLSVGRRLPPVEMTEFRVGGCVSYTTKRLYQSLTASAQAIPWLIIWGQTDRATSASCKRIQPCCCCILCV